MYYSLIESFLYVLFIDKSLGFGCSWQVVEPEIIINFSNNIIFFFQFFNHYRFRHILVSLFLYLLLSCHISIFLQFGLLVSYHLLEAPMAQFLLLARALTFHVLLGIIGDVIHGVFRDIEERIVFLLLFERFDLGPVLPGLLEAHSLQELLILLLAHD